jgi:hypothetical protein
MAAPLADLNIRLYTKVFITDVRPRRAGSAPRDLLLQALAPAGLLNL